jgi:hypothetical protein
MWAGLRSLSKQIRAQRKVKRTEAMNGNFYAPERKIGETVARVSNGSERTAAAERVRMAMERRGELIVLSIQKQA